ncbi:MAG: hypothetical protein ABID63_01495 [Pseudomonadota bacterium]
MLQVGYLADVNASGAITKSGWFLKKLTLAKCAIFLTPAQVKGTEMYPQIKTEQGEQI